MTWAFACHGSIVPRGVPLVDLVVGARWERGYKIVHLVVFGG
jgi:hypothetical protein